MDDSEEEEPASSQTQQPEQEPINHTSRKCRKYCKVCRTPSCNAPFCDDCWLVWWRHHGTHCQEPDPEPLRVRPEPVPEPPENDLVSSQLAQEPGANPLASSQLAEEPAASPHGNVVDQASGQFAEEPCDPVCEIFRDISS